jgi:hypothetical protein
MKTDAPLPASVPAKRAQLGRLADLHIAMWLAGDTITDAERDLLEREKSRRKQGRRMVTLGVLKEAEGITPAQRKVAREWQDALEPCALVSLANWRDTIKEATHVLALPRASRPSREMHHLLKLARRRNVSVRIVLPNGEDG